MDKRQVGRAGEVEPPHAINLSLFEAHCAQEAKQLLTEWRKSLEVRLLTIGVPREVNQKTNLPACWLDFKYVTVGGSTHIFQTTCLPPVVTS